MDNVFNNVFIVDIMMNLVKFNKISFMMVLNNIVVVFFFGGVF